ncbi:MAG: hypothetical protein K0Q49_1833 [Haloplasmataceae bacterium]|jgi:hypothetical protein|nr:hypothetical protein [Haloplasmataceae bacterium]
MDYDQIINELELKRKNITKKLLIFLGISAVIALIGLVIYGQQGFIIGLIIAVIMTIGVVADSANKYKKAFKEQLMPLLIAKTGIDLKYEYKNGLSHDDVMQSRLFKKADRFHSEDLMRGIIDEVEFISSDVRMEERRVTHDSKGRRQVHYVTYYSGRWFIYDFNKEFNGIIQVREDNLFEGPSWGLSIKKIALEDVEFNKKFKTYSSNEHDAFYVLTPSLMEKIKVLEKRYPGKIYFSFIGTKLHIAVYNSANGFEPPIWSPIDDNFIQSQVQDILILKDIIDELKLNRNIFKI